MIKLFCIPYAGGSSASYSKWKISLNKEINLIPIELAGRGKRISEGHYIDFNEMVDDIFRSILNSIQDHTPFALFGHSMGGYIVYEMFERLKLFNLKHIFLSGTRAPHLRIMNHKFESDQELINTLRIMGGTPEEILNDQNFLEILLPIVRSDFTNISKHSFSKKSISVPATILHGLHEEYNVEDVYAWNEYFNLAPKMRFFEGGHFFIHQFESSVIDLINKTLTCSELTSIQK